MITPPQSADAGLLVIEVETALEHVRFGEELPKDGSDTGLDLLMANLIFHLNEAYERAKQYHERCVKLRLESPQRDCSRR